MLQKTFSKTFLKELIIIAIVVAALHHLALAFSLYWTLDWYDIMMHFLGGIWVGIAALFLFFTSGYIKETQKISQPFLIFLILILTTLVVGLVWELWELFSGMSDIIEDRGDTILDLIMDLIGSTAAFYYGKGKLNSNE